MKVPLILRLASETPNSICRWPVISFCLAVRRRLIWYSPRFVDLEGFTQGNKQFLFKIAPLIREFLERTTEPWKEVIHSHFAVTYAVCDGSATHFTHYMTWFTIVKYFGVFGNGHRKSIWTLSMSAAWYSFMGVLPYFQPLLGDLYSSKLLSKTSISSRKANWLLAWSYIVGREPLLCVFCSSVEVIDTVFSLSQLL